MAETGISEDGRRLLREAAVANGLPSDTGNKFADWLDKNSGSVSIEGKTEAAPLRVFGTNPGTPGVNVEPLEGEVEGQAPRGSGPIADSGQIGENTEPDPERASGPHVEQAVPEEAAEEEAVSEGDAEEVPGSEPPVEDTRTVADLKAELEGRGLPTSGTKPELIQRLADDDADEDE